MCQVFKLVVCTYHDNNVKELFKLRVLKFKRRRLLFNIFLSPNVSIEAD